MSQKKRIMLVENENEVITLLKAQAEFLGYQLYVEKDGVNGLRSIERLKPDLVILGVYLPMQSGFDVCRKIKNNSELKHIPVVLLSDKTEELDILLGLELGADDFITKPFSAKILFSKIKIILRRSREIEKFAKTLIFGSFVLEVDRYLLRKEEDVIPLTLSEFGILRRLLASRGKVFTRVQLLEDINQEDALIVDRNIDVHVASLRKKMGLDYRWIETVRGIGYRFREKDPEVSAL